MRRWKTVNCKIVTAAAAFVLAAETSLTALAASPQFAYDEATWEKLQDNIMEYEELPLLVAEYNPTYLNNQTSYQDGKDSKDAREVRQDQYDSADDIYSSAGSLRDQADAIEEMGALMVPGMASAYSSLLAAAVMTEQTALKTEQAADGSYRDSEMDRLDYMASQDAVIAQTQALFASYHQVKNTIPLMEKSLELQEESYRALEKQAEIGMATQIDLLSARKNLQSTEAGILETKYSLNTLQQNLCLMTGWNYGDEPEIRDLPAASQERILSMSPEADIETALAANLSLQSNRRAYANMAKGSADYKNMERTIHNQEETIKSTMRHQYNDIIQKQTALQAAEAAMESEERSMGAAKKKVEIGSLSHLEYLQAELSYMEKEIALQTADMNLQQAIETYEWALKGYIS